MNPSVEYPIRLRLKKDIPVDPRHGMTAGRIVQARRLHPDLRMKGDPWWFALGDMGKEIGLSFRDAEGVNEL